MPQLFKRKAVIRPGIYSSRSDPSQNSQSARLSTPFAPPVYAPLMLPPASRTLLSLALFTHLTVTPAKPPAELRVGNAGHAFDHLGNLGEQAQAAIASGATILYATGIGADGYSGLPSPPELKQHIQSSKQYAVSSKRDGATLLIGYVCATSIVGLNRFDQNWPPEFRARFKSPPTHWRQQDRQGQPLRSWYGGDYEPACMNHPDWREYERQIVRWQLEGGHDGIFFDNPTVHQQGCFCPHCMLGFTHFLRTENIAVPDTRLDAVRTLATERPKDFLRYRATIGRDFLADMRRYARSIHPKALITCNNSLNSPEVFFSQSRGLGYNIFELSKAEDFVVVEDMATQPRVLPDGRILEYGPIYRQLHAISHGKPVVAVTIAEADYHTPARLMRLAMAEAVAHNASYLSWPTWPIVERARMASEVRPQADLFRTYERWLNDTQPRRDAILLLPFQRWVETNTCVASQLAKILTRSNIQYEVLSEQDWTLKNFTRTRKTLPLVICESPDVLSPKHQNLLGRFEKRGGKVLFANQPDWMRQLSNDPFHPSVTLEGPHTLRAVVRDADRGTLLHLYNLNIGKISSFHDHLIPAESVRAQCWVPNKTIRSVTALTADPTATAGKLKFEVVREKNGCLVIFELARVDISTLIVME